MQVNLVQVYVVTGSTKGIGFGLARELLLRGQQVVVNGRSQAKVDEAVALLKEKHPASEVHGLAGNVAEKEDAQRLWDFAVKKFGRVDCWINNAGTSPGLDLLDMQQDTVAEVLATNVQGTVFGCQVAIAGMKKQQSGGRVYFMEGLGTDGRQMGPETAMYGASKYCNSYLATAFENVLKSSGKIQIGRLQPGMVMTDLLLARYKKDPAYRTQFKKICNVLAEPETTVTPWLADGLVAGKLVIRYLTVSGIVGRFLSAPFKSRDLFAEVDRELAESEASNGDKRPPSRRE